MIQLTLFPPNTQVVDIHKILGYRPYYHVYIGRAVKNTEFTIDSKWANFYPDKPLSVYREDIITKIHQKPKYYNLKELDHKILGCWCITTQKTTPLVCHGQILMELVYEKFHY